MIAVPVSSFKTSVRMMPFVTFVLLLCSVPVMGSNLIPIQMKHFSASISFAKRRTMVTTSPSTTKERKKFWNRFSDSDKSTNSPSNASSSRSRAISKIHKPGIAMNRRQSIHTRFSDFFLQTIQNLVEGTPRAPGPRLIHHALYWLTALDAIQCVIANHYLVPTLLNVGSASSSGSGGKVGGITSVYSTLFYFARLRPRLLYSVGALLRALQLCTPLQRIIDPSVGVGAGINFCAIMAKSRWVKPLVLGWATTKYCWVWLGACKVHGAHLPIVLSMKQLKRRSNYSLSGTSGGRDRSSSSSSSMEET
mmetsp:Transcript_2628/g.4101  ORF Transcript_2628/g.4101 Transcript_2628/m.4101 type:complete len:307 (+) Transcript_2628:125-1045(+)